MRVSGGLARVVVVVALLGAASCTVDGSSGEPAGGVLDASRLSGEIFFTSADGVSAISPATGGIKPILDTSTSYVQALGDGAFVLERLGDGGPELAVARVDDGGALQTEVLGEGACAKWSGADGSLLAYRQRAVARWLGPADQGWAAIREFEEPTCALELADRTLILWDAERVWMDDGGAIEELLRVPDGDCFTSSVDASPDERSIAVAIACDPDRPRGGGIVISDLEAGASKTVTTESALGVTFDPTGQYVAVVVADPEDPTLRRLVVYVVDGSGSVELDTPSDAYSPDWTSG